jgi:GMP synthase PP-ATPase subunit
MWLTFNESYTDAFAGPSATIKTHHNVGGLPDTLKVTPLLFDVL